MSRFPKNTQMQDALSVLFKQPEPRQLGEERALNTSNRYITAANTKAFQPARYSWAGPRKTMKEILNPGVLCQEPAHLADDHKEVQLSQAAPIPSPADPKTDHPLDTDWRAQAKAAKHDPSLIQPEHPEEALNAFELEEATRPASPESGLDPAKADWPYVPLPPPPAPPAPPALDLSWLKRDSPFVAQLRVMTDPARDRLQLLDDEEHTARASIKKLAQEKANIEQQINILERSIQDNNSKRHTLHDYITACALLAEQSVGVEPLMVSPKLRARQAAKRDVEGQVPKPSRGWGGSRDGRLSFKPEETYSVADCWKFFTDSPVANYSGPEVAAAAPTLKRASAKKYVSQRLFELHRTEHILRVSPGIYRRNPNAPTAEKTPRYRASKAVH